ARPTRSLPDSDRSSDLAPSRDALASQSITALLTLNAARLSSGWHAEIGIKASRTCRHRISHTPRRPPSARLPPCQGGPGERSTTPPLDWPRQKEDAALRCLRVPL